MRFVGNGICGSDGGEANLVAVAPGRGEVEASIRRRSVSKAEKPGVAEGGRLLQLCSERWTSLAEVWMKGAIDERNAGAKRKTISVGQ